VNEAALILDEGIATRPGDIDVVYVYGYGYPAWRGGPLQWADTLGLAHVVAEMDAFRAQLGDAWPETAPLLRELAAAGETFGAWKGARAWATR
jgi:3-hydroxyacyl-CoA dehydrogenase